MENQISVVCKCTAEELIAYINNEIKHSKSRHRALVSLDFDNFNFINDLFGYGTGNQTLEQIEYCIEEGLRAGEVFSRIHADHFVLWLYIDETCPLQDRLHSLMSVKQWITTLLTPDYSLVYSVGVLEVTDSEDDASAMIDKANFARKRAKGSHQSTVVYYDEKMEDEIEWKKIVTLSMETALKNQEFEMYLQPKILIKTNQVTGAEALARWNSKEYGMIYPDKFIPIMEQNGFIGQLDFFMLEQACKLLKNLMDKGSTPLPISVNFSKVHLQSVSFVDKVHQIASSYGVSPHLIEIEFTESVFSDDFQSLMEIAAGLRALGFKVSLDDFGKAYSSLNYLKDLPFDIIKIDKDFLSSTVNTDKGKIIVAKMVEMIKSMRMVSLIEGVESMDQVDFLKKLSCDLGQGYFYAKPMTADMYMEFLDKNKVAAEEQANEFAYETQMVHYREVLPGELQMDNWELFTLIQNIDMGLIKAYLDEDREVQYINDKALEYFGYSRQEFAGLFGGRAAALVHPSSRAVFGEYAERLINLEAPIRYQTKAIRKDGKAIVMHGSASCVVDIEGRPIGIFAFQDITDDIERTEDFKQSLEDKVAELERLIASEKESREALRVSEEKYKLIIDQSDDIVFEWDFETDRIEFSDKYDLVFGVGTGGKDVTVRGGMCRNIHPEDCAVFQQWVSDTYRTNGTGKAEYRLRCSDDSYLWVCAHSTAICDRSGVPIKAVGVLSNIDKQRQKLYDLTEKALYDPLTKLYNKGETRRLIEWYLEEYPGSLGAFLIVDVDNFKGVNDNLGHQFGDAVLQELSQKTKEVFGCKDILGRLGGDELSIFMPNVANRQEVYHKAELLLKAFRISYFGSNTKYDISASIGIAFAPTDGTTFEEIYRYADIALYESKNNGKDRYSVYSKDMTGHLIDSRTPVEWTERFLNAYFEGDPIYNVFEMLYETKDLSTTVQKVLQMIGERFGVDRAYIFAHSVDGTRMSNAYEWCAQGVTAEKESLQDISTEEMSQFLNSYNREGILMCNDIREMDEYTYQTLLRQGIKSFLHCAICDSGNMTGFIGFDDCKRNREWRGDEIATLGYISRILSVFMLKMQMSKELAESAEKYMDMLDNLNGYVYVIDPDTYEMLYVNNAMTDDSIGASVGQKCHDMAFRRDTPCHNCPAKKLTRETPFATEEIYSVLIDGWVNAAASLLKWTGGKQAALVCCTDITKYKNCDNGENSLHSVD